MVGNPCNPTNGNKHQVEIDYVDAGPMPLHYERFYNSYSGRDTAVLTRMRAY